MREASQQLAGRPQQIGGRLASGLGWMVLAAGWIMATLVSWFGWSVLHTANLAKFVGLPLMILAGMVGGMSLRAGRKLRRRGDQTLRAAREATVRALASRQGGKLTPAEAARALKLDEAQADALLTELAVAPDTDVRLEVTDHGVLEYHFGPPGIGVAPAPARAPRATRVAAPVRATAGAASDDELEELHAIVEPPVSHRAAR